ncbi:hypothetical protein [Chitinophaga tropicalis]|uniref:Uncharacterized protein n=1 Tax=Chitinophaga tropicalis TaxID=2683588 RepID=A0A7K1U088_9BACT|nr:hypothetical protein [Chitinophaga tropicalis]MVT07716.1 hypothetical protein [Chitinophaga tropicalis]
MYSKILIERVNDKIKVISPYNEQFVEEAHFLKGQWKNNAWWFDDSAIDSIRYLLQRMWNVTGEVPYENCCLLIKNYTKCVPRGAVYLFHRMVAKAFSRLSKIKMGADIDFMDGTIKPGGNLYFWETQVLEATFKICNFPLPATTLPEVQKAITEGWCEIKRQQAQ